MLYIIGTGLNSSKDISIRSLEILKNCSKIYQECYTCIQNTNFEDIEKLIDKKIILANRKLVEEEFQIVERAKNEDVAFLVAGTPFFATTHVDLVTRAKEIGVTVKTIHNVSIVNVFGCYGLYSYNFGRTVSVCYFTESWKPCSFYDNIMTNYKNNLHTLCLLDIKTDENRFMRADEALKQMMYADKECNYNVIKKDTKVFVVCRFSTDEESVFYDTIENLIERGEEFGKPLHSIIFPAKLSIVEKEFVEELMK